MSTLIILICSIVALWVIADFISGAATKSKQKKIQEQGDTFQIENSTSTKDEKSDQDGPERFKFHGSDEFPAIGQYQIVYTDIHGQTTMRIIHPRRAYNDDGKFAVYAHCELRNTSRSFIDEHIQSATDLDTGEVIESVAQHAIRQYENSKIGKMWKAINSEMDALSLLTFVFRSDGRMLKAERYIIADYIKRRRQDTVPDDDELDNDELDEAIKQLETPSNREFKRIIAGMKSAGDVDRLSDITDCAKRIVAAQKKVDPLEKAAIEILESAIN